MGSEVPHIRQADDGRHLLHRLHPSSRMKRSTFLAALMSTSIPAPRRDLLGAPENIPGNACLNASIRHHGPHAAEGKDA
ncbi:MAG: hypothetical protein ACT6R4_38760 [Variovorax sp.]